MSLFSEILAFIVVGDARYGRKHTPLDDLNEKATEGLEVADRVRAIQPIGEDKR